MSTQMNKKMKNFEDALKDWRIAQLLENESTLEDIFNYLKRVIKRFCEEKLKSAKLKINKIIKK